LQLLKHSTQGTVVVSVIERTREFGVITSLGLNQFQLSRMIALEAIYTTFIGFVVGAIAGYGLTALMTATNLMGPFIKSYYGRLLSGFALSDKFVFASGLSYLAWAAITILLAAILAITVPGKRVRNLIPAEALRAN